jgi:hypothetical protein
MERAGRRENGASYRKAAHGVKEHKEMMGRSSRRASRPLPAIYRASSFASGVRNGRHQWLFD